MRFATYTQDGGPARAGVVSDAGIHPLPEDVTVLGLVRAGLPAALAAGERALGGPAVPLSAVRLLPPLEAPSVRDFVAFEEHVEGMAAGGGGTVPEQWYQAPTFYFTNPYALIGAHDDVAVPPGCELLDYELEVAVVVGRDGASLSPEQAREHIFGYTVLNDWSARDLQRREMGVHLGPAKGKDFATTLGPWLVTADELEPYRDADGFLALDLRASVNGERCGQDLLSNMGWPFEELIATPRAAPRYGPGTCSAPAPAATAAAWPSCGAVTGRPTRRRCARATWWNWPWRESARCATASSKGLRFRRYAKHAPVRYPG